MPVCPKHDVPYSEGLTCWCCDQEKKKPTKVTKPAKDTDEKDSAE